MGELIETTSVLGTINVCNLLSISDAAACKTDGKSKRGQYPLLLCAILMMLSVGMLRTFFFLEYFVSSKK